MKFIILCLVSIASIVSAQMAGGRTSLDINDREVLNELQQFATYGVDTLAERRFNEIAVSSDQTKPVKYDSRLVSAESQVVAGVNYFLKVRITDASCSRSCVEEECNLKIWIKKWENFKNLTSADCKFVSKNKLGESKQVEIDEKSQAALDLIVSRLNQQLNSPFYHKLHTVAKVQKQLVIEC